MLPFLRVANMKIKLFIILSLTLLIGCTGIMPSENLTGNWATINTEFCSRTKSTFRIVDHSGSLTIYNYKTTSQEYIDWNTGCGTFNYPNVFILINGTYYDECTVFVTVSITGTITDNVGNGDWTQTFIPDNGQSVYGIITFTRG